MSGRIIEPLLYIDQPTIEKPKAIMQDYFYTPMKNKEVIDGTMEKNEKDINTGTSSFKDLPVEGKIEYLLNLPTGVPKIRCEFVTEEKSYRGILLERKDSEISIRVLGHENVTIEIDKLKDINMLGF